MSAGTHEAATASAYTPTLGSLLSAELLRVRSRRFLRWAVVALFGVLALVATVNFVNTAKPSRAEITRATTACPQPQALDESGNPVPREVAPEGSGPQCTVREAAQYGAFDKRPALRSDLPDDVLAVGLGVAVLGFVLGCTLGGADWSQKTMTALLFWEPRRVRVYLVKLLALLITLVAVLVAAEAAWAVMKAVLVGVHGVSDTAPNLVQDVVTNLGRSLVLVLAMGGVAYGIASLARNTGAALGVGFVYFAVVELFINGLFPRLGQWTLTVNIGALFTPGGLTSNEDGTGYAVSSLHGGVVLVLYAAVLCAVGLELFRRRDVT